MLQISISDISKNPSIIDKLDDIAEILNKKTKQVKGIFVPSAYLDNFKEVLDEIEYKKFLQRNAMLQNLNKEDDTLLDGLDNAY
ncbi:MAG: hypothetical protein HF962_03970 [Sulfurovum sp.]|nr:hypothetical protein [Sulfurovum sp.]